MRLMDQLRNSILLVIAGITLAISPMATADNGIDERPSAGAMVADALVARPLYFALSQLGSALYGVTLPLTLLGGNVDEAAEALVVTPLQAGFLRCLGCGHVEGQVDRLSVVDGNKIIRHFVALNGGYSQMAGATHYSYNFGIDIGTHFALSDKSRYDVMLGAKWLDKTTVYATPNRYEDKMMSYQLSSRFGLNLGAVDLMFRLGGHYWTVKRDTAVGTPSAIKHGDGFGFISGVGLDLWMSHQWRLGIDYTHYHVGTKRFGYSMDVDSYDLRLAYMF